MLYDLLTVLRYLVIFGGACFVVYLVLGLISNHPQNLRNDAKRI